VLRRALASVLLVALGLGGVASANLVTGDSSSGPAPVVTTTPCPPVGGTTTPVVPVSTTLATTTARPTTTGVATTTVTTLIASPLTTGTATTAATTGLTTASTVTTTTGTTTTAGTTTAHATATGFMSTATTTTGATTSTITTNPCTTSAVTTTAAPTTVTSQAPSVIVVTGHGWGHGMGMSQWGADGYAHHGWNAARIIAHYYPGTTVAIQPSSAVRVLLLAGVRRVALRSDSPWRVTDGAGAAVDLPPGELSVAADLSLAGKTLVSPLTFTPGQTPVAVGRRSYHGSLQLVSNGSTLQVVNRIDLESYLDGVVGAEMPSSWPAAALEAQAVAARSYALAELQTVVTARAFDLYGDTRSQAYGGMASEVPSVTAAVAATAGQVVLYKGKVATTYFSSSSGGRTVSALEATGRAVPYLASVDDPYDTLSPYHDWGPVLFDAAKVGTVLRATGGLLDLQTTVGPSEHVETVSVVGVDGTTSVTGATLRQDLGLRSTRFQIGWLTLTRPADPVIYGGSVRIDGIARGVGPVALEAEVPGAGWQGVASLLPDASGVFSIVVSPHLTTRYRLATATVRAAMVTVPVVPLVDATLAAGLVRGTVRPVVAGASVQVQRQNGNVWTTVATGSTDPAGSFTVAAQLDHGAYRVRCAAGHGLSPGVSAPLLAVS